VGADQKDKLFFFFNYEHTNQCSPVSIASHSFFPAVYGNRRNPDRHECLAAITTLNAKHMFVSYSMTETRFPQSLEFGDPPTGRTNLNWADPSIN